MKLNCPVCHSDQVCEHLHSFVCRIPVYVDPNQEEPILIQHLGPPSKVWIQQVTEALQVLK